MAEDGVEIIRTKDGKLIVSIPMKYLILCSKKRKKVFTTDTHTLFYKIQKK